MATASGGSRGCRTWKLGRVLLIFAISCGVGYGTAWALELDQVELTSATPTVAVQSADIGVSR